jgi:hypothetical protein
MNCAPIPGLPEIGFFAPGSGAGRVGLALQARKSGRHNQPE